MNPSRIKIWFGISALVFLGWAFAQNQAPPSTTDQTASKPMKEKAVFLWREGILTKHEGKWYLRGSEEEGAPLEEVLAFPWLAFGRPSWLSVPTGGIKPFPRYPREKHERDGHPYRVDAPGSWFGLLCRDEADFANYTALMLSIQNQIGEDPPGQKPTFEGVGFYIVTGH
jgi:hypothetical protein